MMHPQLVAGAWVGFNDNRVTMRSNYWGQGGHNAILVVGDFFKAALESGKLDAAATFPGAPHQSPGHAIEAEPEEVIEEGGDMQQDGVPPPAPPPEEEVEPEPETPPAPPPAPEPVIN